MVTNTLVRKVFRKELDLRYKKIKPLPYQGISEKNLVLRQQFAIKMMELLADGKRIINVDETWISSTSFQRRKWCRKDSTNSVISRQIQPRISMIAAMDTDGDTYACYTTVNTNTSVMKLYLSYLAEQIEKDRPNFRDDTVLLLDGAKYHTNFEIQGHLKALNFPVIYTGPYSYDACPCELLFARIKSADLNPTKLPTGKK